MNNRNLFLAVWERDVYTRGQTRPSPAPTSHPVPTRWGHGLPGASFTRTLRPFPRAHRGGPALVTYSPQSHLLHRLGGGPHSHESGGHRRDWAVIPPGAQYCLDTKRQAGTQGHEALLQRLQTSGRVQGPSLLPSCQPSPQPAAWPAAVRHASPALAMSLSLAPRPPWPVSHRRSPGPRNWLPRALPGSARVPAPLPSGGAGLGLLGVPHPGRGLASPPCSPLKLCPLTAFRGTQPVFWFPPLGSLVHIGVVFNLRGVRERPC